MANTTEQRTSDLIAPNSRTDTDTKALIVVMSDPSTGTEEALGRVFNALATAYDFKQNRQGVEILFHGTGTRWISELTKPTHPAHDLFDAVRDAVGGVSCGCADVFGGRDAAEHSGFDLITDNLVPGTTGLPSLQKYISQGYAVITF
jgi:hypothetical protein